MHGRVIHGMFGRVDCPTREIPTERAPRRAAEADSANRGGTVEFESTGRPRSSAGAAVEGR
ncbi:hypothetical protein BRD06_00585 [Halobacteriales archaeon QS_9_67_15]|nr:MAG: hypothetical protein BRD06_00585 [Halobacteriales archaeon QS_9_67_15]